MDCVAETHWKPTLETLERKIASEPARGVLRIVRPEHYHTPDRTMEAPTAADIAEARREAWKNFPREDV